MCLEGGGGIKIHTDLRGEMFGKRRVRGKVEDSINTDRSEVNYEELTVIFAVYS
jgi:hypothetical protein